MSARYFFVAGILCAKRGSLAPAICPGCTLLVRPIFGEARGANNTDMPTAKPEELVEAILECLQAGANVVNLSAAIAQPSSKSERILEEALQHAARRGMLVVTAAGNQSTLGSTAITRHPWVIPVVAYDANARPLSFSNFGNSIGRHGVGAPGQQITSLGTGDNPLTLGGTSAAAPFVTGAIALLWSEFRGATAAQIKLAITQVSPLRRLSVVPPLLDATKAYQYLLTATARR